MTTGYAGGNNRSSPIATPSPLGGNGTSNGCPSKVVVNTPQAPAHVIVLTGQSNKTATVYQGELIEVRLPFGQEWAEGPNPLLPPGREILDFQAPFGYADQTDHACVWRFIAHALGTETLNLFSSALCNKPHIMWSHVIVRVSFIITVGAFSLRTQG